ncbi:MAG TPA: hypothetical protein DCO89_02285 [Clostridiales bacterium]|nr:hypothetical protein [Clostridiales bacterium]
MGVVKAKPLFRLWLAQQVQHKAIYIAKKGGTTVNIVLCKLQGAFLLLSLLKFTFNLIKKNFGKII